MTHGKHCDCMICSMGKTVGMIKKCENKTCQHPEHKKENEDQKKNCC